MKAYRFRLETVARLRRSQSLLARQAVARTVRDVVRAEEAEAATRTSYAAFLADGVADGGAFLAGYEQGQRLAAAVTYGAERRADQERELARVRELARQAERNVTLLDKLDQRRREEWRQRANREDVAALDEFAVVRAAYRRQAEA